MKHHRLIALCTALVATTGLSNATVIGLPGGTSATTWDTFAGISVPNDAPDYSNPLFNATLTTALAAGMVTGSGDRLYSGSGASSNAFNLTIDGFVNGTLDELSVVLKFTSPSVGTAADFFSVSLTGVGAGAISFLGTGDVAGGSTMQIYQWTWTGLGLETSDPFQITVTSGPDHVSLDAVQLIPEPSSFLLSGLAVGLAALRRRRSM